MNAKRGYVPEDERNFSPAALETLRTASRHIGYLINEGYGLKQASTFVGNHFLLSERQRLAIVRSLATSEQLERRKAKLTDAAELLWIDGFNTVITLEVLLSGAPLFLGMDGALRDLAALRGTYRIIPETVEAARLLFAVLRERGAESVHILLDEPVSNSGRLKVLLAEIGADYPFRLDIQIRKDVDGALSAHEHVVTSDSILLDRCKSWVNLLPACLQRHGGRVLQVWESAERFPLRE